MQNEGTLVRTVGTALLSAITLLSLVGIVSAQSAHSTIPGAGQAVLGICAGASLFGLAALWSRPRSGG